MTQIRKMMPSTRILPTSASLAWHASRYVFGFVLAAAFGYAIAAYSAKVALLPLALATVVVVFWRPYLGYLLVVATLPADVMGILLGGEKSVTLAIPKLIGAADARC